MDAYSNNSGGSVNGSGNYDALTIATLTATPNVGYVFSHWSGDAVGSANPLEVSMDSDKSVQAHFIQESVADDIALNSRSRLGLYTSDQMHALQMGKTVIEKNNSNEKMSVFFGLKSSQSSVQLE